MDDYTIAYSEDSFWRKVTAFAQAAGKEVVLIALTSYYCARDPDTPARAKTVIYSALGYFVFPLDAIPDITPLVGYADDLGALTVALALVAAHIKPEHRSRAEAQWGNFFGK
jgi:uncharacterized membrane protein YkvA (DUF1232 family)